MDYEYLVTPERTPWSFSDAVLYGVGAGVIVLTIAFIIFCIIALRIRYPYEGRRDVAAKSVVATFVLGTMIFSGITFAVAPRMMMDADAEYADSVRSAWLVTNYSWLADEDVLTPRLLAEDRFTMRLEDRNGVYNYDFRFTRTDGGMLLMYGKEKESLNKFTPLLQNKQYRVVKASEDALYVQRVAGELNDQDYYEAQHEWKQRIPDGKD